MGRRKGSQTRCSHCYEYGHNKASCPELKKEIANNPDGYYARQAKRKKARTRTRVCSYCQQPGHNAATCSVKKSDAVAYSHMNWKYQNAMSAIFRRAGFGVGSIIMKMKYEQPEYFLVTGLNLNHINIASWYSRGLGDDTGMSQYAPVELQRIDIGNIDESDRNRSYALNPTTKLPRFAHEEIFGADDMRWDNSSLNYQVVGPVKVSSQKMAFDRYAGLQFVNGKDYKNGKAHKVIKRIKERIGTSEIR